MKKLMALILCMALLLPALAQAEWNDPTPIGNDSVGYMYPDIPWFPFRSSNLTDEEIAELEESFSFVQYGCLDIGLVILTAARYDDADLFGEDEVERIQRMVNIDYATLAGKMIDPQYQLYALPNLLDDKLMLMIWIWDEAEDADEAAQAIFYFQHENSMHRFAFEHVYDEETLDTLVNVIATWTMTPPAE